MQYENLTLQQVVRILNCSYMTVYKMVTTGKLKAFRVGTKDYRVRREELEKFMNKPIEIRHKEEEQ